ncbi:TetR/AcrR family transcriptional regulator [Nocardiopsis salina]|uniref:TetR/AcrR family transcriptional regulator n=1 Tax=Nocardiopsis salina TaxID=245836 RepID=UPI000346408B|nr:TetR/AcrR family transcriptional regulator [Nocardiopsis salina]
MNTGSPAEAARSARAEQRRHQLLTAAARLMERDGFHGVSMQALAEEASVSVGLIYRYFGGKDEVLLAVIWRVLDAFASQVPEAIDKAGADPVERTAAAFAAYCTIIDEHRHAAVLTYRESRTLSAEGRAHIKNAEVETGRPLRACLREAVDEGLFRDVDVELCSYDLLLLAHGWALKYWYFEHSHDLEDYVRTQTALMFGGLLRPEHRGSYTHLLAG